MRSPRPAPDFERRTAGAEAMAYWSMTLLMTRLARRHPTDEVSGLLARMAFHQAWLHIEASPVTGPYAILGSASPAPDQQPPEQPALR